MLKRQVGVGELGLGEPEPEVPKDEDDSPVAPEGEPGCRILKHRG